MAKSRQTNITICGGKALLICVCFLLNIPACADNLPLLNAEPPSFVRMDPSELDPAKDASTFGDYTNEVSQASQGKVFRFKTMPIPVYISTFPDHRFIACVSRGIDSWEQRTNAAVRFVKVDDPTKARIQVVFKRLGANRDDTGCMVGAHTITKYTTKGKGSAGLFTVSGVPVPYYIPKVGPKYAVPPQVIEVNLDLLLNKAASVRYRLLQNVVTHELGHALGLLGHSTNSNDMMFGVTDEHSRLSQRDVNTLLKLYQQKVDVPL